MSYVAGGVLVPLEEAARKVGIGKNTAYRLAKTGWLIPDVLPVINVNGNKVHRAQLERFLAGDGPERGAPAEHDESVLTPKGELQRLQASDRRLAVLVAELRRLLAAAEAQTS
jgi:hypothetical protein